MTLDDGRRWWTRLLASAGLAILCVTAGAEAQQTVVIPRFDFSFSNPGARSAGFGGAFAALADDATAAYANPAGLVQLTEAEVSMEARQWNRSTEFLAGGRFDGEPTGMGLDTREGLFFDRSHSQEVGPSFASVVIPKGRWSFALYGHQLARFEASTESQGFFTDGFPPRFDASRQNVDLEVVTAAMAAGLKLNDRFSLGLGLVFSDTSLRTTFATYIPDEDTLQSYYSEVSFLPDRREFLGTLAFDDTDVTFNAGVLGKVSEQISAGLFYRQGPEARGTFDFELGPAPIFPGLPPSSGTLRTDAVFQVPDVLGGGLAWRSKDGRVTLATEVDRVGYAGQIRASSFVEDDEDEDDDDGSEEEDYQDAWEYHIGAEYALLQTTPILAFRAGYWIAEDQGDFGNKDLTHLSAGIGIAARSFQIDLAADFSENVDTTSLSFIYNF